MSRSDRTPEEVAETALFRQILEDMTKARAAIVAHLGGPWKRGMASASDCIDCPVCGQPESLVFSRSSRNGHIHAGCKTSGCVQWLE